MRLLGATAARPPVPPGLLLPRLTWYQIFMIGIGGTVGTGFAQSSGQILAIAGPGGTIIAFVVVGLVAICVMEGVCDMINLWPISNAMIEFVREFVDPDLAIVVGFTYWYAYCSALAGLIIGAGNLLQYFNINHDLLNVFYVVSMLAIFLINCCGVSLFGWIEFYGGILKLVLLLGIFILMMCIDGGVNTTHKTGIIPFSDGVRNNPNVAATHGIAVLITIPLAVFAYIGVELITVTAFEARRPTDLRSPAKSIAYVILFIYAITIGGIVANVEWFDKNLPRFSSQALISTNNTDVNILGHSPIVDQNSNLLGTTCAPVIATLQAGLAYVPVASILLGFLVYSALSAANTNLYVASRTLYGLTRDFDIGSSNVIERFLAHLNIVTPTWRVPLWSLFASIIFIASWLPFVNLGLNQQDLFQTLTSIGSVGVLLVWASQCLAFLQFYKWLSLNKEHLVGEHYGRFQRWPIKNDFSSFAASLQPIPAWLGLVSCLTIVLLFHSAVMWNGHQLLLKGLNIYLAPAISLFLFIILKIINRRPFVKPVRNWRQLLQIINRLDDLINNSLVNRAESAQSGTSNAANNDIPFVSINGNDRAYTPVHSDIYQPPLPTDPSPFPQSQDGLYPGSRHDPVRSSVQYSVISEVEAEPAPGFQPSPRSPDENSPYYHYDGRY